MKVTLDLPDELVQAIKLRARHQRRPFRDVVADHLRFAVGEPPQIPPAISARDPGKLPVLNARRVSTPLVGGWSPQQMSDWVKQQAFDE